MLLFCRVRMLQHCPLMILSSSCFDWMTIHSYIFTNNTCMLIESITAMIHILTWNWSHAMSDITGNIVQQNDIARLEREVIQYNSLWLFSSLVNNNNKKMIFIGYCLNCWMVYSTRFCNVMTEIAYLLRWVSSLHILLHFSGINFLLYMISVR